VDWTIQTSIPGRYKSFCPLLNHPHRLWVLSGPLFSCLWGFLSYVWGCWGTNPATHLYLVLRLKTSEVRPLLALYAFSMCTEAVLFRCIYGFQFASGKYLSMPAGCNGNDRQLCNLVLGGEICSCLGKRSISFGHLVATSCFGHLQWLQFCVMKVVDRVVFCNNF
jgi:hypothetical protein